MFYQILVPNKEVKIVSKINERQWNSKNGQSVRFDCVPWVLLFHFIKIGFVIHAVFSLYSTNGFRFTTHNDGISFYNIIP